MPLLGAGAAVAPGWWQAARCRRRARASTSLDALARALADAVRAQYGDPARATADLATVTRQIRNALERAEQMRKVGPRQRRRARLRLLRRRGTRRRERSRLPLHPRARAAAARPEDLGGRAGRALSRPAGAARARRTTPWSPSARAGAGRGAGARPRAARAARTAGRCTGFPTAPRTCSPPRGRRPPGARSPTGISCCGATPPWCAGSAPRARCSAPSSRWSSWRAGWATTRRSPASPVRGRRRGTPRRWSGGSSSGSGAAVGAGTGAVRHRLGDLGLDPVPRGLLRRDAASGRPTAG